MDIYQDNYTLSDYNLNIPKPETKSINNGADNMNEENIKKGREFLDKFKSLIDNFIIERATNPEAYLLTGKESDYLTKAFNCYAETLARYTNPLDKSMLPPEVVKEIVKQTLDTFNRKGIKINKLRAFVNDKYNNSFYWSIVPKIEQATDNNGVITERLAVGVMVIIARDEKPQFIPAFKHPFFEAEDIRARARALGLSDIYLFVDRYELNMLDILSKMFNYIDALETPEQAPNIVSDAFISIISTNPLNAFSSIGAEAKKPKIIKTRNEQGKQISIAEYITSTGGNIQFNDFSPFTAEGFLTVGDPNTDKLLLQAQLLTMQTGQKKIEIPLSDFRKFRKLSDKNREAIEDARKACERLIGARANISLSDNSATLDYYWNYVQKCGVMTNKNRAGNIIYIVWSDEIFEHILLYAKQGRQIEQLDSNIVAIPNNKPIAYNIARKFSRHLRSNAGKVNAHRLSIETLLSCCNTLPLFRENGEDIPKQLSGNYINYPSEAPRRIIEPFIDALDFLTYKHHIFKSYKITGKNGRELTKAEIEKARKDYKLFITYNIEVIFENEPNYKNLIESKAKHAEAAEKAKQAKTSNKGQGKAAKKRTKTEPVKQEKAPEAKPIIPKKAPFENL